MAKGPLITRSELRKRQQAQANESLRKQRREESAYQQEEKKIANFYRKENKKNKPVTKTRTGEREKTTKWNSFLMKSLIIVILMLCVVFLAIAFI
ncbi:cell wall synthase accessory phosphoprotein MacP [Enterococcus sp. ZJ1622]|uniref:cell wall synthase accessory phosphoprotein MacP n=1 Tax=Enterococcus sp. ZJ1622 TaxID=2709401 RepID=UPI0013E9BCDB|nr:cell wall synthase accessory phosphoprotein MacP [Enterococcus sp. ZJ1622]